MKINKKFALATAGLLTMSAFASFSLVSCSQGSNPNLNVNYNISANGNKYHVNNNGQIQIVKTGADGKDTYESLPNPALLHEYDKDNKNKPAPLTPENKAKMLGQEKQVAEANISLLVSSYIRYTVDQYLYLLTTMPFLKTETVKNLTNKEQKEFLLAYHLGFGEGTNTYRLRITDVEFNTTPVFQDSWSWGTAIEDSKLKPSEKDPEQKVPDLDKINTNLVTVSGIKVKFGYYKSNGGTSITDITDEKTLQDSNWKSYWRNFLNDGETLNNKSYELEVKNSLTFNIQPQWLGYVEAVDKPDGTKKDIANYYYNGTIQISGFDPKSQNLAAQISNWPFWYSGLKYHGKPIIDGKVDESKPDADITIDNTNKYIAQSQFNQQIIKLTNEFVENKISIAALKKELSYQSIEGNTFFGNLTATPFSAAPAPSTPRR